MVTERRGLYRR